MNSVKLLDFFDDYLMTFWGKGVIDSCPVVSDFGSGYQDSLFFQFVQDGIESAVGKL